MMLTTILSLNELLFMSATVHGFLNYFTSSCDDVIECKCFFDFEKRLKVANCSEKSLRKMPNGIPTGHQV